MLLINTLHVFSFYYRRLLHRLKRDLFFHGKGTNDKFPPFWEHPFSTDHGAFDRQGFLQHDKINPTSKYFSDTDLPVKSLFANTRRILASTNTGLSNVGRTTLTLVAILFGIAGLVFFVTGGQEIHTVNPPDLQVPIEFLTTTILDSVHTFENGYTKIWQSFGGSEHLMVPNQNALICPDRKNNLGAIASCIFSFFDVVIYNILEAIPSYSRYIGGALGDVLRAIAPPHFNVDELINNVRLFVQRFVPLQDPSTEYVVASTKTNGTSADTTTSQNEKASFHFPPFPDDVIEVKSLCENRCSVYSTNATNFLFTDIEVQGALSPTPMTKRDYFFNVLNSDIIYICQYEQESNFGGTWIVMDQTCICSDSCSTTDFFGFTGCADLLNRIALTSKTLEPCSGSTPCTIEKTCPFENHLIEIKINDQSDALYDGMNNVCLDVCSELAGFASFAALLAISATLGAVPTNAFGFINNPFGSSLGVPASLIPGTR